MNMNYCNLACGILCVILIICLVNMFFIPSSNIQLGRNPENFSNKRRKSNKPTMVMFYVDWCGHCKTAKPIFKQFMNKLKSNPNIDVTMINGDAPENKSLLKAHKVNGFPTIKLCKNGLHDVGNSVTYTGERKGPHLFNFLNQHLSEGFTNSFGDGLKGIGTFFNEAGEDVGGILKGTARGVGSLYKGAYNAVGGVSNNLLRAGGQLIDAPFQGVGTLVNGEGIDRSARKLAYGVGDSAKDVGQAIYTGIDNIGDGIVSGWDEFEQGFQFLNSEQIHGE